MPAVVIVGAQWGDEGKGKIVDHFTEAAHMVVRYAGGSNAGHTLIVGNEKTIVRLLPSGVLRPGTPCVLAQGMVIDPTVLLSEIDTLAARGRDVSGDLAVAERAHLVFSFHQLVDGLRENAAGGAAIGTTRRGIGPAYEDKVARRGATLSLLRDPARLKQVASKALAAWAPVITALGGEVPAIDDVLAPILAAAPRVVPLLRETSRIVEDALRNNKRVLFEGAQGTLLDVDHGTYPFVTSSTAVAGGASTGTGIGPNRITNVVGISKAYATRVGGGPFPTELHDEIGEKIRQVGAEFGSVTGRPRRCGWLDLPGLRYAARVNGLDSLAITKLDVLTGLSEINLCVAYQTPDGRMDDFPIEWMHSPESIQPIYETMPGWTESLSDARRIEDLPLAARSYVQRVAEVVGVPYSLVSVGPRRDETILLKEPF